MDFFKNISKGTTAKKILAFISLIVLMYVLRSMLNLLLLTFIFTFIFYQIHKFVYKRINGIVKISRKLLTLILYIAILGGIIFAMVRYVPIAVKQLMDIINLVLNFHLDELKRYNIDSRILDAVNEIKVSDYIKQSSSNILNTVKSIGTMGMNVALAFLLSLVFLLEKEEIIAFSKKIENSKIGPIYVYYRYFGEIFLRSFGKVIGLQIIIAAVNSGLSIVILVILGFPQAIGLGFMIFILGLVPVAGVIVSLIPLSIIAFNIGGAVKIIEVLIMVAVLHALESYILNPKLMSMRTKLPIFFTFIVLLVSEHLMGVWGLLLGIPLFMFIIEILDVKL